MVDLISNMDFGEYIEIFLNRCPRLRYALIHWHSNVLDLHKGYFCQITHNETNIEITRLSVDPEWHWHEPYEPLFGGWHPEELQVVAKQFDKSKYTLY